MTKTKQGINKYPLWLALLLLFAGHAGGAVLPLGEARALFDIDGGTATQLSLPSDVATTRERVYVVDGGNHRIAVFDRQGKYLFAMGREGEGPGELTAPVGIALDEQGRVYVADRGNGRIEVFGSAGNPLRSLQLKHQDGSPVRPIDVAVEADGQRLYITSNDRHSVLVVDATGRWIREWGSNGAEEGDFRYPATITFTREGKLAVTDVLNTRIQLFEKNGDFLVQVGRWGVLPGQLFRPKGIAVDRQGHLLVSDSYLGVIQAFNDDGTFLYILGSKNQPHRLGTPVGMTVDNENRLYVVRMQENKVSVFALGN